MNPDPIQFFHGGYILRDKKPQHCPVCNNDYSFNNIGMHLNEKHGFTVPRKVLRALELSPICQNCQGKGGCAACNRTGFIKLECDKPSHVKCVLCQNSVEADQYEAHVEAHKIAGQTYIKPPLTTKQKLAIAKQKQATRAEKAKWKRMAKPIGANYVPPAKAQAPLQVRPGGFAVVLPRRTVITDMEKPPVVPMKHCKECGTDIARHAFARHVREVHPKAAAGLNPPAKKPRVHIPTVSESDKAPVKTQTRDAVCPRCDGHGGICGGCTLCEGTGWVSVEKERPTNVHASLAGGTITTYDYLGSNAGAHFRESGGRIGSMPVHDNYGEEAEA